MMMCNKSCVTVILVQVSTVFLSFCRMSEAPQSATGGMVLPSIGKDGSKNSSRRGSVQSNHSGKTTSTKVSNTILNVKITLNKCQKFLIVSNSFS